MIDYLINLLSPMILPTIATAISTFLMYELHKLIAFWKAKTQQNHNSELINSMLDRISVFSEHAVIASEQTIVDSLKKTGQWTDKKSYEQAFSAAFSSVKNMAAADLPALAAAGYSDVDKLIETMIESAVKKLTGAGLPK